MKRLARLLGGFGRERSGATAVEFAIIAVPLMLTLLGSVEFGRMLWTRQSMSEVAIMSARCMGVPQTECAASAVRNEAKSRTYAIGVASKWGLSLASSDLALETNATCGGAPGFSRVTVTYQFATVVPMLITQLASNPMTVSACFPNSAAS